MSSRLLRIIAAAAPPILGAVWLVAGIPKVFDLFSNELAVRAYHILPDSLAHIIGYSQPFIEIILGLFLICGVALRVSAALSIALFIVYIIAIISVWVRGLRIDCGCFSKGGVSLTVGWFHYAIDIARDCGFILIGVIILFWPISWLYFLFGQPKSKMDTKNSANLAPTKLNLEVLELHEIVPLATCDLSEILYGGKSRGKNGRN